MTKLDERPTLYDEHGIRNWYINGCPCTECGRARDAGRPVEMSLHVPPPPSAPAGSGVSEEQLRAWAAITDGPARNTINNDLDLTIRELARALLAEMADEARARDAYYEKDAELARCEGALAAERQARLRLEGLLLTLCKAGRRIQGSLNAHRVYDRGQFFAAMDNAEAAVTVADAPAGVTRGTK